VNYNIKKPLLLTINKIIIKYIFNIPGGACSRTKSCIVQIQAFFSGEGGEEGRWFFFWGGGVYTLMFKTKRLFTCLSYLMIHTLFQNGCHYSVLLFSFKLPLAVSFLTLKFKRIFPLNEATRVLITHGQAIVHRFLLLPCGSWSMKSEREEIQMHGMIWDIRTQLRSAEKSN